MGSGFLFLHNPWGNFQNLWDNDSRPSAIVLTVDVSGVYVCCTMARMEGLTGDILRDLYLKDLLTETTIARRFGISQTQVGRLRRKYGIPTLSKSDRFGLPEELSPRLRSIFVGSMLGDGGLRRIGSATARYEESHSAEQRPYLDWKAEEWGPFVSKVIPTTKGEYKGWRLISHSCKALWPFLEVFYPKGFGAKTFSKMLLEWVDALALAVWFMDDGSRSGEFFRFSVGPNRKDQQIQLRILRRLGLSGKIYGKGGDVCIHLQDRSNKGLFLDLVRPYIHSSMVSKLVLPKCRKAGSAPRDLLTSDRLRPLVVDRKLTLREVAEIFQVSVQSVRRALVRFGIPYARKGRGVSRGVLTVEAARVGIERLDSASNSHVEDVLAILSRTEIPLPASSPKSLQEDVERLRAAPTMLSGNKFVKVSWAGAHLCNHFFSHRWDARYRRNPSIRHAWYDPKYLRRAIKFQISVGDPVTPVRVFRALQAVVRGPTNFRPSIAKAVVDAFCPLGGLVLDPCAGYGGRAAGTLITGRRYFGVDPHPNSEKAHKGLQTVLGGSLEFLCKPFEDTDLEGLQADLVFTSPPYFAVERYSNDTSQSWVRYPMWKVWLESFLYVMVEKAWVNLRPGGVFCVNTKDVRDGSKVYPIGGALLEAAQRTGFRLQQKFEIPLGRIGRRPNVEPLYVFVHGAKHG